MKNLLVSFSGGETSGFMCDWLIKNKSDEYNMLFVFANTSKENEETLEFVDYCDKKFNMNLVWIETEFDSARRIGYKITDFKNAKRNGEVFESMIQCYGIPNKAYPHCNRELKTEPLQRFAKDVFSNKLLNFCRDEHNLLPIYEEYYTAIGIRADEFDRVSKNRIAKKLYYPLVENISITKPHINVFWKNQDRRLNLKGYQGNCNKCWKKSHRKLMTIELEERLKDNVDNFWNEMEEKYGDYVPPHRDRKEVDGKITFYRENKSNQDIIEMSKKRFARATDDSINYTIQETFFDMSLDATDGCIESCEPFV